MVGENMYIFYTQVRAGEYRNEEASVATQYVHLSVQLAANFSLLKPCSPCGVFYFVLPHALPGFKGVCRQPLPPSLAFLRSIAFHSRQSSLPSLAATIRICFIH